MELLEAVEIHSLAQIEALIKLKNICLDKNSLGNKVLMRAFSYERRDVIRFLLKNHCSVNIIMKTYAFSTTPLHCAVKLRDVNLIKEILQMDPCVVKADSDGNSALHLAFLHRHNEAVDLILTHIEQQPKYVNARNKNGLTHMHIACTRRNTTVINGFLDAKVDLNDSVSDSSAYFPGYTAFYFAADFGSLEVFKILQNFKDTEPKSINNSNRITPWQIIDKQLQNLMVMAYFCKEKTYDEIVDSEIYFIFSCMRKNLSLLKKFIDNGADVNRHFHNSSLASSSDSALYFAIKSGHKAAVELLLKYGANLGNRVHFSMTPLHWALYNDRNRKSEIVDLLYKAMGNVDNFEDENSLGNFQVAVARNDLEVVKKFLAAGVDVNKLIKPNSIGFSHYTPLHFAVLYRHKEMTMLLIEHGAEVDLFGEENEYGSPLHAAFTIGHKDLIEVLLRSGANAKLRNANGETMLHSLASNYIIEDDDSQENVLSLGKQEILIYIEQLIKLGVDVNAQDKDGKTALYLLALEEEDCAPCLQMLLVFGADINLETVIGRFPFDAHYYNESRRDCPEYFIFYDHVQTLKTLGLYVHPNNDKACDYIIEGLKILELDGKSSWIEELNFRRQQRLDEIARLKNIMITSSMSLYHFLKLEPSRAATYVPNDVLEKIVMHKDFYEMYPSYGYLIRLQYKKDVISFQEIDFEEGVFYFEAASPFK